jgi:REP element-mobilizing transposase RayT
MTLHCAVVMPDHVHMILTPFDEREGRWVPLAELLKSIKSFSASEVNESRGAQGSLWLDENFDRVIRNERDFHEKWDYIYHNPVTAGLVSQPEEYEWFWQSGLGFQELAPISHETGFEQPALEKPTSGEPARGGPASGRSDRPEVGPPAELQHPAVCFIKHTNACGAAVAMPASGAALPTPDAATPASDPPDGVLAAQIDAYGRAYLGDPNAAMGGILAVNFNVTPDFAAAVMETFQRWGKPLKDAGAAYAPGGFFVEVWLAPSFDDEAVRIIRGEVDDRPQKPWGKRVRLLDVGDMSVAPDSEEMDIKRIAGGVLMQTRDLVGLNEDQWKVVTERQPTDAEMNDLRLAWLICKHTKSNAITICSGGMLLGNGAGQMSRVMSGRIATWLAKENGHEGKLKGAVAASDAFFPFRDGPDALADAGVTAFIQPGGSKRDEEVIAACNERGVAMIFTGTRHFKH